MYARVCVSVCTVCLYEGCEPSSLSIAALMSPPVAMRACRLASRLMKPMALSWSSWDWKRTSGVWLYRERIDVTIKNKSYRCERCNPCACVYVCTGALPPPAPPPANIWSICCISCCWAAFGGVPALLGEEAGFSVGMPPPVGTPGIPPVIKLGPHKKKKKKKKSY